MGLEERVARVEGILEQMNKRFDQANKRLSEFREDFNTWLNHVETELRDLRDLIDRNFRWTLGLMITMWVTIILAILFK